MTRKRRSLVSATATQTSLSRDVVQPLEIFETALALLSHIERPGQRNSSVPAPALPSLLARCEAVVGQVQQRDHGLSLLVCADGLDVLAPDWWQRNAGGIGVQPLPGVPDAATLNAQLVAFERGERRQGRHALTLASLDEAPAVLRSFGTVRLVTWHPWASFVVAPRGMTLEAHCRATAQRLDQFEGIVTLRIEDQGSAPADQAQAIAAWFDLTLPQRRTLAAQVPDRMRPPDEIEGGAAYQQLCTRLGYAPDVVPLPPLNQPRLSGRMRTFQDLVQGLADDRAVASAKPARISWFLPRLAVLGLPGSVTDGKGLNALIAALDSCLEQEDARAALDDMVATMTQSTAVLTLLLGAAHWARVGDKFLALSLASEAMDLATGAMPALRQLGASLYADLGHPDHAFHLAAGPLMEPGVLEEAPRRGLLKVLYGDALKPGGSHGHDLLITHLQTTPPVPLEGRKRRLIEIGTTREAVPGQGSTKQIAKLCAALSLDFVTVDMDPENGRRAQRMFHRNEQPFRAVSGKGEDYLAQTDEPLDYVFLDAYDFDHGNHSEWRQSRYTQFLGDRITDAACHQMHLDCAVALVEKLSPDGLICFDDTWLDEAGQWTAKGKTAMPYLLERGFEVIEARDRAALLRRKIAG